MIDHLTIEKIKDAANIVDVVSEFVTLRKSGSNYKGLCPFHNEKTPSFYVSPSRGTCHCFGCGKGGNSIGFIMEHEQMTYPEALRWLASKYHIEIKERELTDQERQEQSERESMFIVNEWTNEYFQNLLHNDVDGLAIGMQYFRSRGFRDDIIKQFQLGYDLQDRYALAKTALARGYKEEYLLKTGICYKSDRCELIDRYAGRVIFPWIGLNGKVIGFTARVLDARTKGVNQKYVNSPASELYDKSKSLYGIYQAKKAMAAKDRVYLVEGQADVISMYQSGIENVVAGSGTALTFQQIHILHRFTSNITMIYDDDAAGIHAAMRGMDMLLSEGMNLKVLLLPDGEDPDSFARKHTPEELQTFIDENETDFMQFKTDLLLKNETDPLKRSEAINSIVASISMVINPILRDTYLHDCSLRIGIAESTLIAQMNRLIRDRKESGGAQRQQQEAVNAVSDNTVTNAQNISPTTSPHKDSKVEQMMIQLIIKYGERKVIHNVEDADGNVIDLGLAEYVYSSFEADGLEFHNPLYNQIMQETVQHQNEEGFKAEPYLMHHHDIRISQLAVAMTEEKFKLSESQQVVETDETLQNKIIHLMLDFRMEYVEKRRDELKKQMHTQPDKMMELMAEYKDMTEIRNALAIQLGNNIIM